MTREENVQDPKYMEKQSCNTPYIPNWPNIRKDENDETE
jgi:hypothetical protein